MVVKTTLLLVGVVIFCFIVIGITDHSHRVSIKDWCNTHNYTVNQIDRSFMGGPFVHWKNMNVYSVVTDKGTIWFRFGNIFKGTEVCDNGGNDLN